VRNGQAELPAIPGYHVVAERGRGGMGVVYEARDLELNRTVAIKMVLGGAIAGRNAVTRFLAEAEALAALEHRNIVRVYDRGEYRGLPYFVMEYCPGGSLATKVGDRPMPPREAAAIVEQLARGVAAAHASNILHRDLKPDNVLFSTDGTPKISDFGLAKRFDDSGDAATGITLSGVIMGTPSYMAPEQAAGDSKRVGPAADVYSLGAILCKLITGRPPFFAASPAETIRQVIAGDPVSPSQLVPAMPRDLVTICMKCLQSSPARRYASATELADDLCRFLGSRPIQARPVGNLERAVKWVNRNRMVSALVVCVVVALLAGATVSYLKYRDAKEHEAIAIANAKSANDRADERDAAVREEAARVRERDAALAAADNREKEKNYQLGISDFLLAVAAYENRDVPLARERLERVPNEQRGWEWHYLRRQCEGGIFTLHGHTDLVACVCVSSDGKRVASGSWDKTARIWDARTGLPLLTVKGHTNWVTSVAFSPDGTKLATAGRWEPTANIWDSRTGQRLLQLKGHAGGVSSVKFSPDGSRLATVGNDTMIRIWDARTGETTLQLRGRKAELTSVSFSPDGTRIAAGTLFGEVTIWDVRNGALLMAVKGSNDVSMTHVEISPDGTRLVAGGATDTGTVWDLRTGVRLVDLKGHTKSLTSVAFSPDGTRIATGSYDRTAKIWDARTGRPLLELKGHSSDVMSVAFSPDGLRLATGSSDKTVKFWDAHTGTPAVDLIRHTLGVMGVAFHPNRDASAILTASIAGTVKVWDIRSGEALATYGLPKGVGVLGLALSPDGSRFATTNTDNTATIWDARTGLPIRTLRGHTNKIQCVAFSADGSLLATGGQDKITKIWDVATGTLRHDLQIEGGAGYLAFSPDSGAPRLATAGVDKTLRIWDAMTGQLMAAFRSPSYPASSPFMCVAFSPDGEKVITGNYNKAATVWNVRTGAISVELHGHTDIVACAAFSPDGKRIVTGSEDRSIRIWDARSGTPLLELRKHTDRVTSVAFSSDGKRLGTSCYDNIATVWDTSPDGTDNELEYRLIHTRPNPYRHFLAFATAKEANDDFAARFHLDRWLSIQPYRVAVYDYRRDLVNDPRLLARPSFHHAEFAKAPYDHGAIRVMAAAGDRLSRRLVAQQLLREGKVEPAVPLLHECMATRPAGSPPVEELLLAAAYHSMNRPADSKRLYRVAAEWLDRHRSPQRIANVVTHAINPWSAMGHVFAPVQDPRYNPFDWESWFECEAFRIRIEALLRRD
jgi:WD40 repeat protein